MTPVILSYYTVDTPYEALAARLRASCERLGLEHYLKPLPSLGSWEANCAMKARVCRNAWQELHRPILWVDADAVIHQRPDLVLGTSVDFAVHKWKGQYFAGGTLFFNQTFPVGRLLDGWVARCESDLTTLDQVHLEREWTALARTGPTITTLLLPRSYYQIFDSPRFDEEPVIEHFQASRTERVA